MFPAVVLASALRGQEIQGFRYLVWTLFFSLLWNFFELWQQDGSATESTGTPWLFVAFAIACLLALPFESHLMYRVLTTRARTMKLFMSEDLAKALEGQRGTAFDIGYIAYFSKDSFCDLAGLVNGPAPARLTNPQRAARCAAQHPDFLFLSEGEANAFTPYMDFDGWRICGQYDFANMREPDRHYLIVKPDAAHRVCAANHYPETPAAVALIPTPYP